MDYNQTRVSRLVEYVQGLAQKENGKELYLKYREDIEGVTPREAFEIFFRQLQRGLAPGEILQVLDKVINIFYKSLSAYPWKKPAESSFLGYLLQENQALKERLDGIKGILKEPDYWDRKQELTARIRELQEFNSHYLKKENILFPYLERKAEAFNGLAIMWALHDEARLRLKKVLEILEAETVDEAAFHAELGTLFFDLYGLAQKEELILFPAAVEHLEEQDWRDMQIQSLEYSFPYIRRPAPEPAVLSAGGEQSQSAGTWGEDCSFRTETGVLDFDQLLAIFNALPVDLTFVDEHNKVRFFTRPKDRIFPRSPAIIGRDVEKCHPPESVHVVQRIIDGFRTGEQDTASFWIRVKGKMVLIQYFALRNAAGEFKGTLEVSQDITGIQALEGERRLLQWELSC